MIKRLLITAAIGAASLALTTPAVADVTNGGFETGDFTGWTQAGNEGFTGVDSATPHSGTFGAFFGPIGSTGSITQTLATTAGQNYTISFWLANEGGVVETDQNSFQALFGGNILMTLTNAPASEYTLYTLAGTASGASTDLTFEFRNDLSFWDLDDVQAVEGAVPEPSTWAMILLGFGAIGFAIRRSHKVTGRTATARP
jgi:hypothetical protein